jgi:beta-glucosidase/6-phospho-beta-glucosidase/beta-galactosidase
LQVLQDSYNGFVDRKIVDDYVNYADILFANFGDRVHDWMTFNEPWITCALQVTVPAACNRHQHKRPHSCSAHAPTGSRRRCYSSVLGSASLYLCV